MSNLFYREGAGFNLSLLKEAKKNYMGRFIFSRGRGSIPMPKNAQLPRWLHLILWQLLFRLIKYDFSNIMS